MGMVTRGAYPVFSIVHFLARARKQNQKKAPMSRTLRVHLRVAAVDGRAETRPAKKQGSDSRRIFIAHSRDARLRDKGKT
jgi:hypothetical protein